MNVFVRDPAAAPVEAYEEYDILLKIWKDLPSADAIVVAVVYQNFLSLPLSPFSGIAKNGLFYRY